MTKEPLTPEIVNKKNPVDAGRERARRLLHLDSNISELTADDLLQHIFELAQEVQNEDPKNAITFRVAIDAFKDLYKEIQGRPPRTNDEDESTAFLKHWGIIS